MPDALPRDRDVETRAGDTSSELASDLIVAEFNYIAQTAFQANEDRARVSQLFFVTFGTVIAALYSSQLSPDEANLREVYYGFALLFVVIAGYGLLTLMQLVRLRQAWRSSIDAMNEMKMRATQAHPELRRLLVWGVESAPPPPLYKPWSVGFMMAATVSALSGIAAGAALAFRGLAVRYDGGQGTVDWPPALLVGVLVTAAGLALYRNRLLAGSPEPAAEP